MINFQGYQTSLKNQQFYLYNQVLRLIAHIQNQNQCKLKKKLDEIQTRIKEWLKLQIRSLMNTQDLSRKNWGSYIRLVKMNCAFSNIMSNYSTRKIDLRITKYKIKRLSRSQPYKKNSGNNSQL